MRYLTIMPDYTESCIVDDYKGRIKLKELNLSKPFLQEIEDWHLRYRKIIPLSDEQREIQKKEIEELDMQGLQLALKLEQLLPKETKIKYFSEGKLKFLPLIIK